MIFLLDSTAILSPVWASGGVTDCCIGVALSSYPSSYLISLIVAKPKVLFGDQCQWSNTRMYKYESYSEHKIFGLAVILRLSGGGFCCCGQPSENYFVVF